MRLKTVELANGIQQVNPSTNQLKPVFVADDDLLMQQVGGVVVAYSRKSKRHTAFPVNQCKKLEYVDVSEVIELPKEPVAVAAKGGR